VFEGEIQVSITDLFSFIMGETTGK